MQSSIKITIPQPCTENWDLMTPNQKGRHCMLCSKTVVDFTSFTDDELIAFFAQQNGNVCGRVKTTQQNRSISPIPISQPTKQRWLPNPLVWVVPMIMGASNSLFSQNNHTKKDSLEQTQVYPTQQKQSDTLITIRGIVLDEFTGEGLIAVTVMIEGTRYGNATDDDGRFEFKIPEQEFLNKKLNLKIRCIGFKDTTIEINAANVYNEHKIVLKENDNIEMLGDITVVTATYGYVTMDTVPEKIKTPANPSEPNLNPKKQTIWRRAKGLFIKSNK